MIKADRLIDVTTSQVLRDQAILIGAERKEIGNRFRRDRRAPCACGRTRDRFGDSDRWPRRSGFRGTRLGAAAAGDHRRSAIRHSRDGTRRARHEGWSGHPQRHKVRTPSSSCPIPDGKVAPYGAAHNCGRSRLAVSRMDFNGFIPSLSSLANRRGGIGRLKKYPCASSQSCARRNSSCCCVSTPSATTSSLRLRAMLITAVTMAASRSPEEI